MPDDNKVVPVSKEPNLVKADELAQAVQAKKEAKEAEQAEAEEAAEIANAQKEAIKGAQQEVAGGLKKVAEDLRKDPNSMPPVANPDILTKPEQTEEPVPTTEGQSPLDSSIPEQTSQPAPQPQEQSVQSVKESVPEKKPNSIWNLFGLFGSKPKDKTDQARNPHPVSEEIVASERPEQMEEKITARDHQEIHSDNPEIGENPEDKQ